MRSDSPAPSHLDTVLSLAPELEAAWPSRAEVAKEATLGLTAMADENEAGGGEDQPSPDENPEGAAEAPDNPAEESPSFLDEYNVGEIADPEARAVAESYVKRVGGAYTRQRQADSQTVQEAQQYEEIVQGLMDPAKAPAIAEALGIDLGQAEETFPGGEDFGFDEADPNEIAAALRQEFQGALSQRDQALEAQQVEQAETVHIAEGIERLEDKSGLNFSEEEIDYLSEQAERIRDGQGNPDVGAAFRLLESLASNAQNRLIKRKTGVPRRMGKGVPANEKVDLTDETQRRAAMAQAAAVYRASGE